MNTAINHPSSNTETILVTGGTGMVGSHLIAALLQQGKQVKALYRNTIPQQVGFESVQWIQGDILDIVLLDEVMKDISIVYHCAAIVSFDAGDKDEMFSINVNGTENVVNACLSNDVKKLCYVSSVAALGRSAASVISEKNEWITNKDNSNYAISKHLAEMEVWRGVGEGLDAVIVNPSIILGSADWSKGSTAMFKTAYNEFPWYTEGVTGFVDVIDVVNAMILLTESDITNQRFILSAENLKYKDVFSKMAVGFNKRPPNKKVSSLMANVVWRAEAIKSLITGNKPLLTKETATAAQAEVLFNSDKLLNALPSFTYTPISETIQRVCSQLKEKYKLP